MKAKESVGNFLSIRGYERERISHQDGNQHFQLRWSEPLAFQGICRESCC